MFYDNQIPGEPIPLLRGEESGGLFPEELRALAHRDIADGTQTSIPELSRLADDHNSHAASILREMVYCNGMVPHVAPDGTITNYDEIYPIVSDALANGDYCRANIVGRLLRFPTNWFLDDGK